MWAQLCPLTSPNLSRRGSAASPAPRASRRHRRFVLWDAGSRGGAGSSPDHSARTHSPARTAAPARSSPSPASRRTRKRRMRSSSDRPPPSPPANRCCLHVAAPRGSPALLAETSAASPRRGPGGRRGAAGDGGRLGSSAPPCTPLGPPNSAPGKTEGFTCPGGGGGGHGEDEVGSSLPPRRAVDGIEDDGGIREVRTFCFGAAPRLQGAPRGSPPPGMAAPNWGGGGLGSEGIPATCGIFPAATAERGPALAAEVEAAERSIVRLSREVRGRPGVQGPPAPSGLTAFRPRCRSPTSTARFRSSAGSCSACWSCFRAARRPPRALVVRPELPRRPPGPRRPPPPPGAPPPPAAEVPPAAAPFPPPPAPRGWAQRHRARRPPPPRSPRRARPAPSRSPRPHRPRCRPVPPTPSRAARPAPARSPAPVPPAPAEPRGDGGTGTPRPRRRLQHAVPARVRVAPGRSARILIPVLIFSSPTGLFVNPPLGAAHPSCPVLGAGRHPGRCGAAASGAGGGWWHPRAGAVRDRCCPPGRCPLFCAPGSALLLSPLCPSGPHRRNGK